jgi:hypothetical protein
MLDARPEARARTWASGNKVAPQKANSRRKNVQRYFRTAPSKLPPSPPRLPARISGEDAAGSRQASESGSGSWQRKGGRGMHGSRNGRSCSFYFDQPPPRFPQQQCSRTGITRTPLALGAWWVSALQAVGRWPLGAGQSAITPCHCQ